MDVYISLLAIIVSSVVIYFAGMYFTRASESLGNHFKLPKSVKGATFDAISSSLPELLIALYSVLLFHKFEVGVGTIVGSALFNLLIIPGICVLIAPVVFKIEKEVITRELFFYALSVVLLLLALISTHTWLFIIPATFLLVYVIYIRDLVQHTKRKEHTNEKPELTMKKSIWIGLGTLIIIAAATYILTRNAITFSEAIGISPFIIAFTIIAAATSVPDGVISFINARKGSVSDAASNVFGSNIFDILVGLALPALIAIFLFGPLTIVFEKMELAYALLVATVLVYAFTKKKRILTKTHAIILLILYAIIVCYAILF